MGYPAGDERPAEPAGELRCVVTEMLCHAQASRRGGTLGDGAVAEVVGEHRPSPMKRVGVADVYGESAGSDELLNKYGLTAGHIAEAARSLLERRAAPPIRML